jgi:hypothetical protein
MMRLLTFLLALVVVFVSLVSPLPYIEHLEGEQGYHKDTSGAFVLDGSLTPTINVHVILPT